MQICNACHGEHSVLHGQGIDTNKRAQCEQKTSIAEKKGFATNPSCIEYLHALYLLYMERKYPHSIRKISLGF